MGIIAVSSFARQFRQSAFASEHNSIGVLLSLRACLFMAGSSCAWRDIRGNRVMLPYDDDPRACPTAWDTLRHHRNRDVGVRITNVQTCRMVLGPHVALSCDRDSGTHCHYRSPSIGSQKAQPSRRANRRQPPRSLQLLSPNPAASCRSRWRSQPRQRV